MITVLDKQNVSINEDRNACILNVLGDSLAYTLRYFTPIEGKQVVKPVPTTRTTLFYELTDSNYQIVHNLKDETQRSIRLLKINENGDITDVVRLLKKNSD